MNATAQPILSAKGLTKEFRGFVAVKDVNLAVREGTVHALIGPNGAGKTTVFNLLTKFLTPSRGQILFRGADITAAKPAEVARMGLVRSFQISAVFPHLSVLDNVRVALQRPSGLANQFWRSSSALAVLDQRALELIDAVNLSPYASLTASELSYGRKRALEIATTLALDPAMLLLDEPMAGHGARGYRPHLRPDPPHRPQRTVLMVEHNLHVVSDLCDFVTVLARGEILAEGPYATSAPIRASAKPIWEPTMSDAPLLDVRRLHAWYGESHVLHGVDLEIREGETVTLLGRNGAGKTTTLRAIMGILRRREGVIRLRGKDLLGLPLHNRAGRSRLCAGGARHLREPERRREPDAAAQGRGRRHERRGDLLALPQSARAAHEPGHQAVRRRAADARHRPHPAHRRKVLLLDEPTEGLAPVIVQRIGEVLVELKRQGMTILLVEQNFRFAKKVADRFYLMEDGRMVDSFPGHELDARMDQLHEVLGVR